MPCFKMSILSFEGLLKFIYFVSRFSGLIFITIDFKAMTGHRGWRALASFVISFGFSCIANSYDAYFAIAVVTHSKLMEIGVNLMVKFMIWVTCFIKLANAMQSRKFFEVISNLITLHEKVGNSELKRHEASNNSGISYLAVQNKYDINDKLRYNEDLIHVYRLQLHFLFNIHWIETNFRNAENF